MTVRETQFLLRGFPSELRTSQDEPTELFIQKCSTCGAAGFPGIGKPYASVCVRSKPSALLLKNITKISNDVRTLQPPSS